MMTNNSSKELLIAGTHIKNEAYPNVLYRIRSLLDIQSLSIVEINCDSFYKKINNIRDTASIKNSILFFFLHFYILIKIIVNRNFTCLYIPYPAIFLQGLLSLLPSILKPNTIILDAFISIYDTIVIDRKLLNKRNLLARLLFLIERRAFKTASYIIVDTENNKNYYSELFEIPSTNIIPIPLATNEDIYQPADYIIKNDNSCRVLFIGTLIPLHGIPVIMDAIKILKEHKNISFHIIGNGQDSHYVKEYASEHPDNFSWTKNWSSSEQLSQEIINSDICLGIFGTSDKTQRVCPYKIYHYSRIGRSIITSKTEWISNIGYNENEMPFMLTDVNDHDQLANRILQLALSPELRINLAKKSNDFYKENLTVDSSTKKLLELIR